MKDTLQYIVTSIVDSPDDIRIEEETSNGISNFTIFANKNDIGRIIGREGKIIRSIRNIMKIKAMKDGSRVNITIADTEKNETPNT